MTDTPIDDNDLDALALQLAQLLTSSIKNEPDEEEQTNANHDRVAGEASSSIVEVSVDDEESTIFNHGLERQLARLRIEAQNAIRARRSRGLYDKAAEHVAWEDFPESCTESDIPGKLAQTISKNDGFRVIPPPAMSCEACSEEIVEGERIFVATTAQEGKRTRCGSCFNKFSSDTHSQWTTGMFLAPGWYRIFQGTRATFIDGEIVEENNFLDGTEKPFWSHIDDGKCSNWTEKKESLEDMQEVLKQGGANTGRARGDLRVLRVLYEFHPDFDDGTQEKGIDWATPSDDDEDGNESDESDNTITGHATVG